MPLKLICGPIGSGKTARAIEAFIFALDAGRNSAFIAPSGPDARHFEREILRKRRVITGGGVTTFGGLVNSILASARPGFRIIDEGCRLALIRAVIDAARLRTLMDASGFDGFVAALARLFSEIELLGMEPGEMQLSFTPWSKDDIWRQDLVRDLFSLYQEYRQALKQIGALDGDAAQRRALEYAREGVSISRFDTLIIDGFWDFTPFQHHFIRELAREAEVLVTVPYEPENMIYEAPAFHLAKFQDLGEPEHLPRRSDESRRPGLVHLTDNLFQQGTGKVQAGEDIFILKGSGLRGQADLVAAEILKLYRAGRPLDDIAVICRGMDQDLLSVAAALEECGVPYELPAPVPLKQTPVGAAALAALDFASGIRSRQSLLTFLRSGLANAPDDLVDGFDRETRLEGVEERDDLFILWKKRAGGMWSADMERLLLAAGESVESLGEALLEMIGGLVCRESSAAGAKIDSMSLDLKSLEALKSVCGAAAGASQAMAGNEAASTKGEAARTAGAEPAGLLRRGVNMAVIRLPAGRRRNCVRLLDPHRVLNQRFDIVFVCGLLEKQFPSLGREDAFFSDQDRRELAAGYGLELRSRERRLDEERFLFHRAISRARRRLYLCYPYCDKEGRPTVPSLFMEDALALFEEGSILANTIMKEIGDVTYPVEEARTPGDAVKSLALASSTFDGHGAGAEAVLEVAEPAGLKERLRACIDAAKTREPELTDKKIIESIAAQEDFSVTGLQRYLGCPFRYFVEKMLDPADMDTVSHRLRRGTAIHRILCRFGEMLRRLNLALPDADEEQAAEIRRQMNGLIEEEFAGAASGLQTAILKTELVYHLNRYIDRERDSGRRFQIYDVEVSFGGSAGRNKCGGRKSSPDMLNLDGVRLRGRIDRIDWAGDQERAMIIDYKAAKSVRSQNDFDKAREIQIPLYMQALEIFGLKPIAGEYCSICGEERAGLYLNDYGDELGAGSGQIKNRDFVDFEVFQQRLEDARTLALEAVEGIRRGGFPREPLDKNYDCRFCEFGGICRRETSARD